MLVNVTEAIFKTGKESGDAKVWAASTLLKAVNDIIKSKTGNRLHEFESGTEAATAKQLALFQGMTNFNQPGKRTDIFEQQKISDGITKNDIDDIGDIHPNLQTLLAEEGEHTAPKHGKEGRRIVANPAKNRPGTAASPTTTTTTDPTTTNTINHTDNSPSTRPKKDFLLNRSTQKTVNLDANNRIENGYQKRANVRGGAGKTVGEAEEAG